MSESPWLNDDQQRIWRDWLLASARINDYLENDLTQHNLHLGEYEVLVCLSEAPDHQIRMADLAKLVHSSRSRLSHTISRMESRGLVERTTAAEDGRGIFATLTDEGMGLLETAASDHVRAVRRILVDAVQPADFSALGRAMRAVLSVAD